MSYTLIRGTYHIVGYSPDGDTIRFKADNFDLWDEVRHPVHGWWVKTNAKDHAALRLEGIDTPETHFQVPGGVVHQPRKYADPSTDKLLALIGFAGVVWSTNRTKVTAATNDGLPGYILTAGPDKNRRAISFAFTGLSPEADGTAGIDPDEARLKQSLNYKVLAAGWAYPGFYEGLPAALRGALTTATTSARNDGLGFYPDDKTTSGFLVNGTADITEDVLIYPKLFRRLAAFLEGQDAPELHKFPDHLSETPEAVFVISEGEFVFLHDLVEVVGNTVRLLQPPENLIFRG